MLEAVSLAKRSLKKLKMKDPFSAISYQLSVIPAVVVQQYGVPTESE
jgi:hypothetical protein